eukprot:gnl/MRDRNA2_/MRDRNA2_88088_c0_seq1.p1 gnl/MRDRNA2_/MRDRNA2_88088_c0~~gnl/MRDRNA2_/MRDRNA2_88088_c0_seq1.p1  ORF type:complete len:794 (-),score=241.63 gnl/MRDRNA2_/MRDRNA2_88088_c0_seq1:31-2412(-)
MHSFQQFAFFLVGVSALRVQDEINPIRKVTGMLEDMKKELEREQEMEAELFEKAMCACDAGQTELEKVIDDTTAEMSRLTSKIEEETSEKEALTQELKDHYANKESAEADLAKASELRKKESTEYSKSSAMNKFGIEALGKAIPKLEGGASSASLMQDEDSPQLRRLCEVTRYLTPDKREIVLNFLDDGLGNGETQSSAAPSEIIGILKSMKDQMAKDLADMVSNEKVAASGYGDLKGAKKAEISVAAEAIAAKEKRSGELAVSLAESKDASEDASEENADASKYLKALTDDCTGRKKNRDLRKQLRAEEISAISAAIKILTEDDSLDTFKKALPSASLLTAKRETYEALVQYEKRGKHTSKLLQVDSDQAGMMTQARKAFRHVGLYRAASIISNMQKKHPTKDLSLLMSTVNGAIRADAYREDPGTAKYAAGAEKVVDGMINEMVHILHDEDVGDEHKKEWCSNETETLNNVKTEKQDLTDQLTHSIEEMDDELVQLKEDIKVLEEEIAANDKEVFEATALRKKEHQEFVDTFSTLDTARRLIDKAATRLHKFYNPEMMKKKADEVTGKALSNAGLASASLLVPTKPVVLSAAVQKLYASYDGFIQKGKHVLHRVAPPVIPDTPGEYKKKESGGVIGMMQKIKEELTSDMTEGETEEKFSAKDYVRLMKQAQGVRAADVKRLNQKNSAKSETEDKHLQAKELRGTTLKELENLNLYGVQLATECDFLVRNFEARHEGRVGEEAGLEDAKSMITDEAPPSVGEIKAGFDAEKGEADVEEHFPEDENGLTQHVH